MKLLMHCAICGVGVAYTMVHVNSCGQKVCDDCPRNCAICSEPILDHEEVAYPWQEPYRLIGIKGSCHEDCCREAAWNAEEAHRSDRIDHQHAQEGGRA